jgi:hypothetical protein
MNETNNINEFLDNSMKSTMLEKTSDDFTAKLMIEIELSKAFQKEDKKTFRALNIFVIGIIGSIIASAVILAALLGSQPDEENPVTEGFFSAMYSYINAFSQKIFGLFGLSMSGDTVLYVMGIGLAVVLYSVVDKFVLKRSYN